MRKVYLDNIRFTTVFLVLIYHVIYFYNAQGLPGGFGGFYEYQPWDIYGTIVYPWFMALLFVIAGISARYSFAKRTDLEFIKGRVEKLLVPSTLGLLLLPAIVGYLDAWHSGVIDSIPKVMRYPFCIVSGICHLWFLQVLFVLSLVLVLLRRFGFSEKLWKVCEKTPLWLLIAFVLPIWGSTYILTPASYPTYRFGIFGLSFLLGYYVFSHDEVQEKLEKAAVPLLIAAVAACAAYLIYFHGQIFRLRHPITNLYLWLVVLAVLGCGKKWFNRSNKVSNYFVSSSFGVYIVHYVVSVALCLALQHSGLPVWLIYTLAILGTFALSFAAYEILRRIPVLRFIIFGIRKKSAKK